MTRPSPDLSFEAPLWMAGMEYVAGLDEAGRGAWAGPVSAAAVILPPDHLVAGMLHGVRDSKLMTPLQRARWAEVIMQTALGWGVAFATHQEIDELGIVPATRLAMTRALEVLGLYPGYLLLDAIRLPGMDIPQQSLIKGDQRSLSIAAASVLAKTGRDALMEALDEQYPGYAFSRHKGYGTRLHQEMLHQLGHSPVHRMSFKPLKQLSITD
jgi:ribonuclease HII